MNYLLVFSDKVDAAIRNIANASAWLFLLMMATILLDVVTRKFGFQMPGLGSTRLQELEWHYHTALFALWLGANVVSNGHVRVDVLMQGVNERKRVWVEWLGMLLLALPFSLVLFWYGFEFALTSYQQGEGSSAPNGVGYRWLIKAALCLGLLLLLLSVLSKIARCWVFLFADKALSERAQPLRSDSRSVPAVKDGITP